MWGNPKFILSLGGNVISLCFFHLVPFFVGKMFQVSSYSKKGESDKLNYGFMNDFTE